MIISGLPTKVDDSPEWGSEHLDLDAYLARIGYQGPRDNSLDALWALHRAHMSSVCFENIDIALGRDVSLDLKRIEHKLVHGGRGGYCYETNLLFAAALDRLGFPVTRLLSRIREGSRQVRSRSHTSLLVRAGGEVWLADPGYGSAGLIEPMELREGATSTISGWTWRLIVDAEHWVLQCLRPDGWFDLYAFREEPQYEADFRAAHHTSSTRQSSPFVGKLVVQQGSVEARHLLRDNVLVTDHPDGRQDREVLSGEETACVLRDVFNLPLTDDDERLLLRFLAAKRPSA